MTQEAPTLLKIVAAAGKPWTIRLVRRGDRYGHNFVLTHERDVPLVEFYDARFGRFNNGWGQFVNRYVVDTLIGNSEPETILGVPNFWRGREHPRGVGLNLQGGVPGWQIDGATMDRIIDWLRCEIEGT